MLAKYMGVKKTENRILTNFYWKKIHQDVVKFCKLGNVCQRIASKSSVAKALLGKMPIMDLPFKRVTVDLIGLIASASNKRHRVNKLTFVNYATRYTEAILFKNNDIETGAA